MARYDVDAAAPRENEGLWRRIGGDCEPLNLQTTVKKTESRRGDAKKS